MTNINFEAYCSKCGEKLTVVEIDEANKKVHIESCKFCYENNYYSIFDEAYNKGLNEKHIRTETNKQNEAAMNEVRKVLGLKRISKTIDEG